MTDCTEPHPPAANYGPDGEGHEGMPGVTA